MTGRHATLVAIVMVVIVACSSGVQPTPALAVDTVAVVATDDLVIHVDPGPELYGGEPRLPRHAQMYVVRGPVRAGGSEWYEMTPLTVGEYMDYGWVAGASPSGEPWIMPLPGEPDCPDTPRTVSGLARLPHAIRLACFRGVPITVQGRPFGVGWAASPEAGPPDTLAPIMLIDPQADEEDVSGWLTAFILNPASVSSLASEVITVTGMFDHPDAAGCAANSVFEASSVPDPPYCRSEFVVTRIE